MVDAADRPGLVADGDQEAVWPARSNLPGFHGGAAGRAGHQGRLVGRVRRPCPARLPGSSRFIRFGATFDVQICRPVADRSSKPHVMRCPPRTSWSHGPPWLDLTLLAALDGQVDHDIDQLVRLPPASPFAPLLRVAGGGAVRGGNYEGALGDPARYNHRQV